MTILHLLKTVEFLGSQKIELYHRHNRVRRWHINNNLAPRQQLGFLSSAFFLKKSSSPKLDNIDKILFPKDSCWERPVCENTHFEFPYQRKRPTEGSSRIFLSPKSPQKIKYQHVLGLSASLVLMTLLYKFSLKEYLWEIFRSSFPRILNSKLS